jgi:hypothetical protein
MEDINTILILFLVLVILFMILTHVNVDFYNYPTTMNGKCSETKFGCCPDGSNSKIDFNGTNCPPYNPGAGYYPSSTPVAGPNPYNPTPVAGPNPYTATPVAGTNPYTATPVAGANPYTATPVAGANPGQQPVPAPGAQPYLATYSQPQPQTYTQSQPQTYTQTQTQPQTQTQTPQYPVRYANNAPPPTTTTSSSVSEPGPRQGKAAGGMGARYPSS